ncbi:AAA family ATPase [Clostridium perfringens]|nr:AAA family ATPase [Clostridium perfringens]MDM0909652.1 AAA family ATPase [Clostridium perfringens]
MYLSRVKIWNFRKYGESVNGKENLTVNLKKGLNLMVGENDSGKTAIIDAIKIVLGTQSFDNVRLDENDFYRREDGSRVDWLKIECKFDDLSDIESGRFLEWIELDGLGNSSLKVRITARMKDNKIIVKKTGGREGVDINFEASECLRVTYLKPLRDAENELSPGYRSRFAQVLKSYPIFKTNSKGEKHPLEEIMKDANDKIDKYFTEYIESEERGENPTKIITTINNTLESFLGVDKDKYDAKINISSMELSKILSRLSLALDDNKIGLGTLNQLYMSMELLLLEVKEENNEFGLALIEEIEAHIHPQAQLRVINHLENTSKSQIILTTHSITLASIVKLENLIICKDNKAYSLSDKYTNLLKGDYEFLERFLDSTKANLFFAKGVIFVEGDAENILIPTIAEIIGKPLYKYGVSIVNVGNVAFLRYSNIFVRKNREGTIGIPTSIITDLDVRPIQYYMDKCEKEEDKQHKYTVYRVSKYDEYFIEEDKAKKILRERLKLKKGTKELYDSNIEKIEDDYENYKKAQKLSKEEKYNFNDIKVFTNNWTMEFDIALSCIKEYLYAAILIAEDIQNSEKVIENIEICDYIENAKNNIDDMKLSCDDMKIAYEIYKPLLNKSASKAVSAQYLSKILIEEVKSNTKLIEDILNDKYLMYIVNAIKYVTNTESEVTIND